MHLNTSARFQGMKTQTRPARLHVQSRRQHHVGHILVSALPPTSTFWLFQAFLGDPQSPPGLLGEVPSLPRPSWGSPQPLQAFLGGLPNFPGSFLRAHGYGGHRQSDPWVIYSVLQTHSLLLSVSAEIPGPGPSNSISHFAPTFWVLW